MQSTKKGSSCTKMFCLFLGGSRHFSFCFQSEQTQYINLIALESFRPKTAAAAGDANRVKFKRLTIAS